MVSFFSFLFSSTLPIVDLTYSYGWVWPRVGLYHLAVVSDLRYSLQSPNFL